MPRQQKGAKPVKIGNPRPINFPNMPKKMLYASKIETILKKINVKMTYWYLNIFLK